MADPVSFGFNAKSRKAQAWAKKFAGDRIRKVDAETKLAVRQIVVDSIHKGIPPKDAAKQIRSVVGMNRPQAKAWQKYYQGLSPNLSPGAKSKAGDRLRKKYIRRRAMTIARTEVIDSLSAGTEQAWTQAQKKNLLGKNAKKKWLATSFGACAICRSLAMEEAVPLNKNFKATIAPFSLKPISRPTAHPNCRCALIPVPGTGGSMFPGGAGVVSAVSEAAWMDSLLSKKVGGQKGSNLGGLYEDAQGKKHYVKEYKNPQQAMTEAAANSVYRELGFEVPESFVRVGSDGKTYFVSKWIDDMEGTLGQIGMTAKDAEQILDGFVADVFTANWDAVGTGLDNVVRLANGKIIRIDQGGAFLFRAQGALKPPSVLGQITEWENFVAKNPYYKQVFQKAGLENADALAARAVKQIDELQKLRLKYESWDDFLKKTTPNLDAATRMQIAEMMEKRFVKLINKRTTLEISISVEAEVAQEALGKAKAISKFDVEEVVPVKTIKEAEKLAKELGEALEVQAGLGLPESEEIITAISSNLKMLKKVATTVQAKGIGKLQAQIKLLDADILPRKTLTANKLKLYERNKDIWKRTLAGEKPRDIAEALNLNVNNVRRILRDLKKSPLDVPSADGVFEALKSQFKFWADTEVRRMSLKLRREMTSRYHSYLDSIKKDVYSAVRSYTGGYYTAMNESLRIMTKSGKFVMQHTPKWTRKTRALQGFLVNAPRPPKDLVVWRGTDIIGRVVKRKGKENYLRAGKLARKNDVMDGDILQLDGFQSTAINPEKAWAHGHKVMLEIHPTCGAYVDIISTNSGEREFIMPHGQQFRVAGIKELKVVREGVTQLLKVIQMEALGGCPKLP